MISDPQQKLPEPSQRGRLWRTEHIVEVELHSDDGHGWAVSYSDLLMVLMSFFVLFFSFDEKKPEEILQQIALSIGKESNDPKAAAGATAGHSAPSSTEQVNSKVSGDPHQKMDFQVADDLGERLKRVMTDRDDVLRMEKFQGGLEVVFRDNLFAPGKYELSADSKTKIDRILQVLLTHQDKIDVYFVGHADSMPVFRRKSLVQNNFVLSSLRATSVLSYALSLGFSPGHVFAQANGDNTERLRTISLRIQLAKSAQLSPTH